MDAVRNTALHYCGVKLSMCRVRTMCRNLGICNRAVKKYIDELREAGLVAEANGHYVASEPSVECGQWFVQKGNADNPPWHQRFASYAVYVPNPHQGLPLTHSALLSLVWSLKHGSGWTTIRPAALATMLFPEMSRASAKRQINRAAKNLRDKGLMDHRWNITVEKEHYHLWRDADHLANPRSRSDGGLRSLRDLILDYLEGYECHQCFSCGRELGIHLDYIERMMKKAGYNHTARQNSSGFHDRWDCSDNSDCSSDRKPPFRRRCSTSSRN